MSKIRLPFFETLATVAWFSMDIAWMRGVQSWAIAFGLATTLANLLLVILESRDDRPTSNVIAAASVWCWSCMNMFWMIGDFGIMHNGIKIATIFAIIGTSTLVIAALLSRGQAVLTVFRRAGILRRP